MRNRRIPPPQVARNRTIAACVAGAAAYIGALVAFNQAFVAPRDEMVLCGLRHTQAQDALSCQDAVWSGWSLGQYLSQGVSPSEAARAQAARRRNRVQGS